MLRGYLPLVSALALGSVAAGCGDDIAEPATRDIALFFEATVDAAPASCSTLYAGLGGSAAEAQLADARLFVSQIEVRASSGEWVSLDLDSSEWQHDGVALLDFEDATGACADSGTSETNTAITGVAPAGEYDMVRFRVGVPFALNHLDSATAPAPFNVPGMFWTWQGGYKFLRVDWLVTGGAVPRWNIHIGSTGCESSAPTEAPADLCARPNLTTIEVGPLDLDTDIIAVELASLVAASDLVSNATDTPPGCMSSPGEPQDCDPVFTALGLSFDAGECVDGCASQALFAVKP